MEKERQDFVDVAKGICMLAVISIHTEVFQYIGIRWTDFAVPMFFFMSGFFDKSCQTLGTLVKKYAKTLILPSVIWVILGKAFFCVINIANGEDPDWLAYDIYSIPIGNGAAWFLIALFYVKIMQWVFSHCVSEKCLMFVEIPLALILGYIGTSCQMPLLLDEGMAALPFYVVGKYTYPYLKMQRIPNCIWMTGLLCYALLCLNVVRYNFDPIGNGSYSPMYLMSFTCTVVAFSLFLGISVAFTPPRNRCRVNTLTSVLQRFIADFGRNTLGVLLVHVFLCHTAAVVLHRVFERGTVGWIILFFFAYFLIVIVSYIFVKIVTKYCPILFGKI